MPTVGMFYLKGRIKSDVIHNKYNIEREKLSAI